jgi:periplasmic divalent cation tolerance protein
MRDDILIAYVTCATRDEARRIGSALVENRLAACVNIREHEAIFRWEGRIESNAEFALLAKTTAARFPGLSEAVQAMHSYALPCIVAMPVVAADDRFLDWVAAETGDAEPDA